MKNKIKTFSTISIITAILVFVTVFAGCNNSVNSGDINKKQKVKVKFSTTIADSARSGGNTVLPDNVTNDDITKIILTAKKRTGDSAPYSYEDYTFDNNQTYIEWLAAGSDSAYDIMTADSVTLLCDTYKFTLELYIDDDSGVTPPYKLIQQGTTEDTAITQSSTTITVSTQYVEAGDFSYTIIFNPDCKDSVGKLEVGLFTQESNTFTPVSVGGTTYSMSPVTLETWTDEASQNVKRAVFRIQNLPEGQYYLKYIVYYDAAGSTPRAWFGPLSVLANGYKTEKVVRLSESNLNSYSHTEGGFTVDDYSLDFVVEMVSVSADFFEDYSFINNGEYKIYAQKADGTKIAPSADNIKLYYAGAEVNSNTYNVSINNGDGYSTISWDNTKQLSMGGVYALYVTAQNASVISSIYKNLNVSHNLLQTIDVSEYNNATEFQTALESIRNAISSDTTIVVTGNADVDENENTKKQKAYLNAITETFYDYSEYYSIDIDLSRLGESINKIEEDALAGLYSYGISSIILSPYITEIEAYGISSLPDLESLTIINNGVNNTHVCAGSLNSLPKFETLNIVDKGTLEIESGLFYGCTPRRKINLIKEEGVESRYLTASDGQFLLYNNDGTGTNPNYKILKATTCDRFDLTEANLIVSDETEQDITNLITIIGQNAFDSSDIIELGSLGDAVTTVEANAFRNNYFDRIDIYKLYPLSGNPAPYQNIFNETEVVNLYVHIDITEENYEDFKNYIYLYDDTDSGGIFIKNADFLGTVVFPEVDVSTDNEAPLFFRSGRYYGDFNTIKFHKSACIGPGQFKSFSMLPCLVGVGSGTWYSSSTYPKDSSATVISDPSSTDFFDLLDTGLTYIIYEVSD